MLKRCRGKWLTPQRALSGMSGAWQAPSVCLLFLSGSTGEARLYKRMEVHFRSLPTSPPFISAFLCVLGSCPVNGSSGLLACLL